MAEEKKKAKRVRVKKAVVESEEAVDAPEPLPTQAPPPKRAGIQPYKKRTLDKRAIERRLRQQLR